MPLHILGRWKMGGGGSSGIRVRQNGPVPEVSDVTCRSAQSWDTPLLSLPGWNGAQHPRLTRATAWSALPS
jgi:hypothetical protein